MKTFLQPLQNLAEMEEIQKQANYRYRLYSI